MEEKELKRSINKVDFLPMKNFNGYLLDADLNKIFDFGNENNPNIKIFRIVERNTRYTVGAIEFLLTPVGLDIKLGLNSTYRDIGNGTELLKTIMNYLSESLSNTEYFVAHIAPDNLASQKMFSKCGFIKDFDSLEEEISEGYLLYHRRNPNYGKKNHGKDAIIFYASEDYNPSFKFEVFKTDDTGTLLEASVTSRVTFRKVYDGMEIITEYQDNIEELVKTIWYVESRFEVIFPDSLYFTYALRVSENANKKKYIDLFKKYYFTLDEYSSSNDCLVFKRLNKHYTKNIDQILRRARVKKDTK